jgi:DtxR family Mn-dependent transcriptional regulator
MTPTGTVLWLALGLAVLGIVLLPRAGLLARVRAWGLAAQREQVENALKVLLEVAQGGEPLTAASLAQGRRMSARAGVRLMRRLRDQALVTESEGGLRLTPAGERWALQVMRAHRLWERYLADEARLPLGRIHMEAHRREHGMSPEAIEDLDDALGRPALDPHGDPIPDTSGRLRSAGQLKPLPSWPLGMPGRVAHLEDEPPVVYAQLLAQGIRLGQVLHVVESRSDRMVVSDGETEYRLAPAAAANIALAPLPAAVHGMAGELRLSQLPNGSRAKILALDEACQGFTRRRFLDLGLTPGTAIVPELANAFREPRAYRLRGTLIALRNDQAGMIWVRPVAAESEGGRP